MNQEIEKSQFKPLFEAGNMAQLERMNQFFNIKTGWDNFDLRQGSYGLRRNAVKVFEVLSLYESVKKAISENEPLIEKSDVIDKLISLRRKASDAANHSHMIILKCDIEIEALKDNKETAKYSLSEKQYKFPTVSWICDCGYQYSILEGFKTDDSGDIIESLNTHERVCTKCKKPVEWIGDYSEYNKIVNKEKS